jgi:hypothetical protein
MLSPQTENLALLRILDELILMRYAAERSSHTQERIATALETIATELVGQSQPLPVATAATSLTLDQEPGMTG